MEGANRMTNVTYETCPGCGGTRSRGHYGGTRCPRCSRNARESRRRTAAAIGDAIIEGPIAVVKGVRSVFRFLNQL